MEIYVALSSQALLDYSIFSLTAKSQMSIHILLIYTYLHLIYAFGLNSAACVSYVYFRSKCQ